MPKFLMLLLCLVLQVAAREASSGEIAHWIAQTKQAIVQEEIKNGLKENEILFLTFWNFDNTILSGDTTEGKKDIYGKVIYKGLEQVAIEHGFSKQYPTFVSYLKDYAVLEKEDEPKAWSYNALIFAGSEEHKMRQLAREYFETTLKPHIFQASLDLIRSLQSKDITVYVITASPRIFVQGAAPLLNIPIENIYGMEAEVKNGILTNQPVLPLTTGNGKIRKIQEIVDRKLKQYKKVYVLAGFGNHNANDMPFLEWIAKQKLPAGHSLSVVDYHAPQISQENVVLIELSKELKHE